MEKRQSEAVVRKCTQINANKRYDASPNKVDRNEFYSKILTTPASNVATPSLKVSAHQDVKKVSHSPVVLSSSMRVIVLCEEVH